MRDDAKKKMATPKLTDAMKTQLWHFAVAELGGFSPKIRHPSACALMARKLVELSNDGRWYLAPAAWAAAVPLLSPPEAESASLLATGVVRIRRTIYGVSVKRVEAEVRDA